MITLTDITELKRAEEALQESESRYRSLFDNMLEGFAFCRMFLDDLGHPTDFVYLDVNSAFARLTGLEDVTGRKVTEVIPGIKESNPELFEICCRVALTGRPEKMEIEIEPLGRWFSISVYSPEREYFIVVFDNITERKQVEEKLRSANEGLELGVRERTGDLVATLEKLKKETAERQRAEELLRLSEERYRKVVEDQTETICRFKADGTLDFVNEVYCRIFGKTSDELLGSKWHPRAFPEDVPMIKERLREMSPSNPVVDIENRVYPGRGSGVDTPPRHDRLRPENGRGKLSCRWYGCLYYQTD